jgi:hypothetical protein
MISFFLLLHFALASDPAELVADGWDRVLEADYDGATLLARKALESPAESAEEATYLLGFATEWGGNPREAVSIYNEQLETWPSGVFAIDARFRRIEARGHSGDTSGALKALRRDFKRQRSLSSDDALKVGLLEATWLIQSGKDKKGTKKLERLLLQPGVPYYHALARATLCRLLVQRSHSHSLDEPRTFDARLSQRAALLDAALAQLEPTIALSQHRWALIQLHLLGLGYERLGDDLLRAPTAALSASEQGISPANRARRVEGLWMKGLKFYDLGIDHAARVQWKDVETSELAESAVRLRSKIEQL